MTGRVLVLVAVLAASSLAGAQDPPEAPARARASGGGEDLQLSDAQREQLRQITLEARKGARRRQAEIDVLHLDIQDLLDAPALDEAALSAKVQQLGDLQFASVRAEVESRVAMRKILTPEQIQRKAELQNRRSLTGRGRGRTRR